MLKPERQIPREAAALIRSGLGPETAPAIPVLVRNGESKVGELQPEVIVLPFHHASIEQLAFVVGSLHGNGGETVRRRPACDATERHKFRNMLGRCVRELDLERHGAAIGIRVRQVARQECLFRRHGVAE